MVSNKCWVVGCKDSAKRKYMFPKYADDLKIWVERTGNPVFENLSVEAISRRFQICRNHFDKRCDSPGTRQKLKHHSLPTLNLPRVYESPLNWSSREQSIHSNHYVRNLDDDNFIYDDHQSIEEAEVTEDFEEANETVKSITLESHEENKMAIHGDKRLWVKASDALFTDPIKEKVQECEYQTIVEIKDEIEEVQECEYQTIVEIKDEIEEVEEEEDIKIQPIIVCKPIPPPPPAIDIRVKKSAASKVNFKAVKKPRGRTGRRPRPILPMTRPIASTSTSHLEQASTQHQLIVPSTQMPGIAYQIFLGDHGKNSNNSVQYTMLQPRPVFLQSSPTSVSNTSPVVISQSYPVTRSQVPSAKIAKIAPKIVSQAYCSFCYKLFKNINEHVKECWANPESKSYKFRKIAPSTL